MNYRKKLMVTPGQDVPAEGFDPGLRWRQASPSRRRSKQLDRYKAEAGRHAADVVRRPQPCAADRAAGHRRRRQGWRLLARGQRHGPAGLQGAGLQAADTGGEGRTISSGASIRMRRPRARSRCSTARITRTCWSSASTSWCRRRSGRRATSSSTTGRGCSARRTAPRSSNSACTSPRRSSCARFERAARRSRTGNGRSATPTTRSATYLDDYLAAFDEALTHSRTSTRPGTSSRANHKWFRNLAVSQIVADAMEDMKLKLPKPTVDLAQIRKLYHAAAKAEGGKARGHQEARPARLRQEA